MVKADGSSSDSSQSPHDRAEQLEIRRSGSQVEHRDMSFIMALL